MPGAPGSSRGCTTCRKRKVRCDLRLPICARCIKAGRTCEGYERHPIFHDWTTRGAENRRGLVKAKPSVQTGPAQVTVTANDLKQILAALVNAQGNRMISQVSSLPTSDGQIIALFYEKYLPTDQWIQNGNGRGWFRQAIGLQNPGEALQMSLKAMSMTRLGRLYKDDRLAFQGATWYGKALRQLRRALKSETGVYLDETLAAGFLLALYELFEAESPISSLKAWVNHMAGLENIVSIRGPQIYRSQFGREVLEDIRFSSMVSCLENRRTSVLAQGRWAARSWDETSHSVHPRIYDKGFVLAALLEEIDIANLTGADTSISTLSHFLQCAIDMDTDLDNWYEEYRIRSPSPLYWPAPPSIFIRFAQEIVTLGPRGLPILSYPDLVVAIINLDFWALKLILSNEIGGICQIILSRNYAESADIDSAACLPPISTAQWAESHYGPQSRIDLATDIARSMPYCLNHTMGMLGPERSLFPLRTAMSTLRRHPGPELEWCQAVYREMDNGSGLCGAIQSPDL